MPAAAITGLAAEARIARRFGLSAFAVGSDPRRIAAASERLVAAGASSLVSFGIAGGLDPVLRPGTLLLPRFVVDEGGGRHPVDADWHARLLTELGRLGLAPSQGDVLGAAHIAATAQAKAAMRHASGAVAVDLESHMTARAAARAGIPFIVFRAVADPAGLGLPRAATIELDDDGRPVLGRVLRSVAGHPAQMPALIAVARHTRRALRALATGAVVFTRA